MANSSSCINDVLPLEILQKILILSVDSFHDALHVSTTCQLWRKLIFNPLMIEHYWTFDDEHRKKDLVRWWNFNENASNQNNPFVTFPTTDCFLGKCATLIYDNNNSSEAIQIDESQTTIDRGGDYTIALWLLIPETVDESRGLFIVSDDDWDYHRGTALGIGENNSLSIVFESCISHREIKSDVKVKLNEWFHIALVQTRKIGEECPAQNLWINGELKLTVEIPIAAFSEQAEISFFLFNQWNRSLADISVWSRCLSPIEIRAIYEQKTSIDKVNVGKYICEHSKK